METKNLFSTFLILTFLLTACGQGTAAPAPVTQTPVATQPPTDIPTQTALPTIASFGSTYPTPIPYPTASVVKSNAVAFIAENALWVANVDGSGERKLTDIQNNESWTSSYLLKWSPDGKWIGYISGNDLWVISPDGSTSRKVIEVSRVDNKNKIWSYSWSPDSSEIAYIQTIKGKPIPRLLNLGTGDVSDLPISTDQLSLSWSPDGRYILLNTYTSLTIFEVAAGKILKEINLVSNIQNDCPIEHGGVTWSPNSKWLYHLVSANGTYYIRVCMNGLDGTSWQAMDGVISVPEWDETGNFLYFITRKGDIDKTLNLNVDEQLMRYDARTQETKRLLSLTIKHTPYSFMHSISISPDRRTLLLRSQYSETQQSYALIDLKSLTIIKNFTLELGCVWSHDNKNFICLSQSNGYTTFYKLNIQTNESVVFSGEHSIEHWASSPISTTP